MKTQATKFSTAVQPRTWLGPKKMAWDVRSPPRRSFLEEGLRGNGIRSPFPKDS
jgi:hypothetical protein